MEVREWRFPKACQVCGAVAAVPYRAPTEVDTFELTLRCNRCLREWRISAQSPRRILPWNRRPSPFSAFSSRGAFVCPFGATHRFAIGATHLRVHCFRKKRLGLRKIRRRPGRCAAHKRRFEGYRHHALRPSSGADIFARVRAALIACFAVNVTLSPCMRRELAGTCLAPRPSRRNTITTPDSGSRPGEY